MNNPDVDSQIIDKQYYRRVFGIFLLVVGMIWLDQFEGTMFLVAKIEFVLAAILYTKMPRLRIGRSFRLEKEWRSGKDWAIAITTGILMGTGLTVFGRFEPYSLINSVKFVIGAVVLMYAIEMILGKTHRKQITE